MNEILVKKANGCRIDRNSMYEKDLSTRIDLSILHSTSKGAQIQESRNGKIPDYLDYDIDITASPLYQYLNNE